MDIKIKVFEGGSLPAYKRDGDACLDCKARINATVEPGKRMRIPLGFALELPPNWEAQIRPRSGLTGDEIDVALGTGDSNYRGELQANVINNSSKPFVVEAGDRICQLAIREAPAISFTVVDELSETNRGVAGFGSSGIK